MRTILVGVALLLATPRLTHAQATADSGARHDTVSHPDSGGHATAAPHRGFLGRLFQAYADDWKGTTPATTAPGKRGVASPVDGPPFPFSDWPYGGSVDIGAPWTNGPPLMQAIWGGPGGDWFKKTGIQIYGWLNVGANISTSANGSGAAKYGNFPAAYYEVPNSVEPDQEVIYIERQPNTVQTDHIDWGFRIANLWGIDYRFTTAKGIFSQQLLEENREYGDDPVMAYFDLYIPKVAQGMDVRVGRYISLPDIEAQLAPNNYTYSHSLLYSFDAYTQTGINTTTKLSDHWLVQLGLSPGNDVAPWTHDARLTLNACVQYTWTLGADQAYVCENSLNDGDYAYNNVNSSYATWYHRFGKSSWHSATESWYQYERGVPNVDNPAAASLLETGANGAHCVSSTALTCFAPEWAIVNYLEKEFSAHDYLSIRNEFFDDIVGQRTGTKSRYTEHLLGFGHWIGTTLLFRPEIRYERSYDAAAYSNGLKQYQVVFASDIIFFY
jgi:hypothetical protein